MKKYRHMSADAGGCCCTKSTIERLKEGNAKYVAGSSSASNIGDEARRNTSVNGQNPYVVVVSCSDSRVPVEHIFNAGIGDVFVIRTAGNVIGNFELGSIEYGAAHLHVDTILILGHTGCGAVNATISGGGHDHIARITEEIAGAIGGESDPAKAEMLNVKHGIAKSLKSEVVAKLVSEGKLSVIGGIYDICSGKVEFL